MKGSEMTTPKVIIFDMHLRVSHDRVATIIDALSGACEVIKIEQFVPEEPDEVVAATKPTKRTYANGIRNKGIAGIDLLFEHLKDGPRTKSELGILFARRGFAKSTIHPVVSRALQAEKITINGDGLVALK